MSTPLDLRERILRTALDMAARVGVAATTRNGIAARAECSSGSVSFHFGDERKLKRAIVNAAIARNNLAVLGWAIAERHSAVATLDPEVRALALRVHLGK